MCWLEAVKSGAGLLLVCSIGCHSIPKFPAESLYEFDPYDQLCSEYKIVDYKSLEYIWVKDIPFKDCPPIFGFYLRDVPYVLEWGKNVQLHRP